MPQYPYSYFKPTGKEQGAMAIGSLLAGLLSAAQPRQQGEASPALKGIAGAVGGYGSGYKAYQDMMGDAFTRDLYDRKFGQDVDQFDQQMGLNREKFGEEKRQFETSEKPYRESSMRYTDAIAKNYDFDNQMSLQKMVNEAKEKGKNERYNTRMGQIEMGIKKNQLVNSRPGKQKTYANQAQFESMYGLSPDRRGSPEYLDKLEKYKSLNNSQDDWMLQFMPKTSQIPQQGAQPAAQNAITEEDIQFTAKKYGIPREEVLKRLGAQ